MGIRQHLKSFRQRVKGGVFSLKAWRKRLKALGTPISDVIKNKHRFVVIDSNTYKEKLSFELTAINVFVALGVSMVVLVLLTTVIIAFTPLRELIPGYTRSEVVDQTYRNAQTIDSLEREIARQEWMIADFQQMFSDGHIVGADEARRRVDSLGALNIDLDTYYRSLDDSSLRHDIESASRK